MQNDPGPPPVPQRREQPEPSERTRPIPLVVAGFTAAMVLFGAVYLFVSESFGLEGYGDRRTAAELSGPAPGSGGAANGKAVFAANCAACHQATGQGVPGVFPPLAGSEWVKGDEHVVANILVHGIEGEIEVAGATYKGSMPSFKHLGDAELAAVASYVRGEWSNGARPIEAARFAEARKSGRTKPFAGGAELKTLTTAAR